MRSNHHDRPAAASKERRGHGAEAMKCSRQICGQHLDPIFFTLSKKEMARSDSGIADKHRRYRYLAAGDFHHPLHRMRLANIGFVECPGSAGGYHLRERVLGSCLVSMVMYPDRPAGRRKGQADRSTNPSGRTGHKHRMCEFASLSRHLGGLSRNWAIGKSYVNFPACHQTERLRRKENCSAGCSKSSSSKAAASEGPRRTLWVR